MSHSVGAVQIAGDLVIIDGKSYSFETLLTALNIEAVNLTEQQLADQLSQMKQRQDLLKNANTFLAQARNQEVGSKQIDGQTWQVDQANRTITLDNGYSIKMNEANSEWVLNKLNDDGTTTKTRIWGDPHVNENAQTDSSNDWDFYDKTSFVLRDGTKITVDVEAYARNRNEFLSSGLTITKGDQAIVVGGLSQNRLGDLSISQVTLDGFAKDAAKGDGVYVFEGANGQWLNNRPEDGGQEIIGKFNRAGGTQAVTTLDLEEGPMRETAMSTEMADFFQTHNIPIVDADGDGRLSADDWKASIENLKNFIGTVNSESQLDMISLQKAMNTRNQYFEKLSNLVSKLARNIDAIVGNLR